MGGGTGAVKLNGCDTEGVYCDRQPSGEAGRPPAISDGLALGWALISTANWGTGRAFISAARIESRTKSCMTLCWRKRTSVFEGCTLQSTSPLGNSRNNSTTG